MKHATSLTRRQSFSLTLQRPDTQFVIQVCFQRARRLLLEKRYPPRLLVGKIRDQTCGIIDRFKRHNDTFVTARVTGYLCITQVAKPAG